LVPQEAGWTAADLKDNTGYSVMFGPDKCGSTNKVHFILRIKNPITGEYVEHHLNSPPFPINDKNTHVYTAVIKPKEEKVRIGTLLVCQPAFEAIYVCSPEVSFVWSAL
jgi:calnexin